jgi:NAD(P)-dependent dehydrogenase (short-subunit alcohol dehydrogenase family)
MTKEVVLITGASRGIGAACARLFAEHGYRVAVNYAQDERAANEVVGSITDAGGEAVAIRANVADPAQVRGMFETLDVAYGPLDVLVNNAGVSGPRCRIEELELDDLRDMLATNVIGPVACAQAAITRMSTRHGGKGGAIINVSSGSAYIGNPGSGVHYAITKGALNSFNIGASQELVAEGIRVNAVAPGMTETDMVAQLPAQVFQQLPMNRAAKPVEIAQAIYWLATANASYVAGANIRVGGGRP